MKIYNGGIYGSNLYSLDDKVFERFATSYNAAIRHIWRLPNTTHRYWIEELSGIHLDTAIKAKMINFYKKLLKHHKQIIRVVANGSIQSKNTLLGRNITIIKREAYQLGLLRLNDSIHNLDTNMYKRQR